MKTDPCLIVENGEAAPIERVPELSISDFRAFIIGAVREGKRIAALFADAPADASQNHVDLFVVLADERTASLNLARARVDGDAYDSITPECAQAHLFEREIAEQYACIPRGHPWLKPLRFHAPYRSSVSPPRAIPTVGDIDFYRVEGDEVHEVAVGPVHAGVIEPGHFRFQCHGEKVFHLEISLGYQHRGVERHLPGGPAARTPHLIETLAGDTTIGHATAYCHAVEALAHIHAPAKAQFIRGIALELERLANHVGDLGALAGDIGYLPTAAYCGRLRGDFLNFTALICGNRFGRDLTRPGGVLFDIDDSLRTRILHQLDAVERDTAEAVNLLWSTSSVISRFEDTGRISDETAIELGIVGPAARACGIARDVRSDFPKGVYRYSHVPVSTWDTGDVFARAHVRWLEIQGSIRFLRDELRDLPAGPVAVTLPPLRPAGIVASLVEGWRGEICHVAMTGADGLFSRYKVVDPSFHNWFALAFAMRGQEISDFPLCNKSFNLSYSGFDL